MNKKLLVSIICFASSALFGMRNKEVPKEVFGCQMDWLINQNPDLSTLGQYLLPMEIELRGKFWNSKIFEEARKEIVKDPKSYTFIRGIDIPRTLYELACALVEQYHTDENHAAEQEIWTELNQFLSMFTEIARINKAAIERVALIADEKPQSFFWRCCCCGCWPARSPFGDVRGWQLTN